MRYCLGQVKQKKLSVLTLGCVLSLFLIQEQALSKANVYKQVGPDGQIEYSDQPSQESTQMILPEIQINPPAEGVTPAPKEGTKSAEDPKSSNPNPDQKQEQLSIAISSPIDQQFFTSVMTEVPVTFVVQPKLSPTQKIKLLLDNQPYGEPQNTSNVVLKNLERGTHEIKAMVIDENNQILATSAPVTFQQQRQMVNKKP
jgi:hypothetical protein